MQQSTLPLDLTSKLGFATVGSTQKNCKPSLYQFKKPATNTTIKNNTGKGHHLT
jgi:hypothetical protein